MDIQGNFEPLFKMNHLAPISTSALPLPVKFRPVFYDPNLLEKETSIQDEESDPESVSFDTESTLPAELNEKFFFKDPLQLPNQFLSGENIRETNQDTSPTAKLGKSMRSSSGLGENGGHKKIYKLMAEGNRILDLQKEQRTLYNKQVVTDQAAAVIVNDLLRNGFHITPPESTPRLVDDSWTSPTFTKVSSSDDDSVKHVVGSQLIVAMHRELKRLQSNDADIS